jgi:2-keto-4-pentenoate hydratase
VTIAANVIDGFLRTRRARPKWIAIAPELRPKSMEEGYQVQKAIHERLDATGPTLLGYKVGSTTAAGQKIFGIGEPVYAGLFSDGDFPTLGAALANPLTAPSLECEIAMRLGSNLDGARGEITDDETMRAIATCHLACEIIDNRYGDPMAVGVPSLLADDWFNVGFVLGPPNPRWPNLELSNRKGQIEIDGVVATGNSNDWLPPIKSVQWLAQKLAQAGRRLRAGDIILTGTIVAPTKIKLPAKSASISIEGFGTLNLGGSVPA